MPRDDRPTVWTSEDGDLRKSSEQTSFTVRHSLPPKQQIAYLHRESKGRGGKTVTIIKNLILTETDLKTLSKMLKQTCGTGGTIKDGVIEMQGEHRDKIAETLRKMGYTVKIAGG